MTTISDRRRDADIRRREDGSIDTDFYVRRAMTLRAAAFGEGKAALAGRLLGLATLLRRPRKPQPRFGGPAR